MRLEDMKNIGKNLADELRAAGIQSPEDLVKMGSLEANLRIHGCANRLYALEGAILDVRWHGLDKTHRSELYQRYLNEASIRDQEQE